MAVEIITSPRQDLLNVKGSSKPKEPMQNLGSPVCPKVPLSDWAHGTLSTTFIPPARLPPLPS